MDYTFSFNGRMLLMLGVVLALLMALSFGLGTLYGEARGPSLMAEHTAAAKLPAKLEVKGKSK